MSGRVCDTGKATPILQAPRRISVAHQQPLDEEIDNILKAVIIKPAPQSAWASPVILVTKNHSQKSRLMNDHRPNTLSFPLQRPDSVREILY